MLQYWAEVGTLGRRYRYVGTFNLLLLLFWLYILGLYFSHHDVCFILYFFVVCGFGVNISKSALSDKCTLLSYFENPSTPSRRQHIFETQKLPRSWDGERELECTDNNCLVEEVRCSTWTVFPWAELHLKTSGGPQSILRLRVGWYVGWPKIEVSSYPRLRSL